MRELIGHDASRRHLLQPIVADRRGGTKRFLRIARLEHDVSSRQLPVRTRLVAPHASETIGLELERDRGAVRTSSRAVRCARVDAGEVLNVVAELVRDDVRLCEIARRAEAL